MFLRKATFTSTTEYSGQIERLRREIAEADVVVIGAGSGLSAAAGLTYSGPRFQKNFADYIAKYHFADMYSATFYPYRSLEEYWGYMSRLIWLNRYGSDVVTLHRELLALVQDKDYFVLTTNVDHCFQKAGFDKQRLFYTQGDYGLFQCSKPCREETHDNEESIQQMLAEQNDLRIPTELIPHCPRCGRPMTVNLRCDMTFVQDKGWHSAKKRYEDYIRCHSGQHILFLELGVGGNTPVIIKYSFWKMTQKNPKAIYACVNLGEAAAPEAIENRSICMNVDIGKLISDIHAARIHKRNEIS